VANDRQGVALPFALVSLATMATEITTLCGNVRNYLVVWG
jgi:hypothetical protein